MSHAGIDLDGCRNPISGEIRDWAKTTILRFNSYTEVSPSGTGVKIFVKGKLPGRGAARNGIEVYSQGRFFTVTGMQIDRIGDQIIDGKVNHRQKELTALYQEITKDQGAKGLQVGNPKGWEGEALKGVSEGGRHHTGLRLAGRWANKGHSPEGNNHFLISWNETNKPPKPELSDPNSKELTDIIQYVMEKNTGDSDSIIFPSDVMT